MPDIKSAPLFLTITLLAGCGSTSSGAGPAASQDHGDQNSSNVDTPAPAAGPSNANHSNGDIAVPHDRLRDKALATPTTLRIVNGGSEALKVVVSFGELAPFSLERETGMPVLTLSMDHEVTGPSCHCRCGFSCLECEPPLYQEQLIAPGASYEVRWAGWVRAWRTPADGEVPEACHDPFSLAPGTWRLTACVGGDLGDQECQSQAVELPAEEVTFTFPAPQ